MTERKRLHALFEDVWERRMADEPELATYVGWPGHDGRWSDLSIEAIERRKSEIGERLHAIRAIDPSKLDETDRLSHDLFRRDHEIGLEGNRFPSELLPVQKNGGIHEGIAHVLFMTPPDSVVPRLHGLPELVAQVEALLERGLETGVTPPRLAVEPVPEQIERMLAYAPEESPFLCPTRDTDGMDGAAAVLSSHVAPAFRRLRDFLADRYVPRCRESIALSDLPDGREWYEWSVRRFTTTTMAPVEIHELGMSEVSRIHKEMEEAITRTGFAGTFHEFTEFLRTDDRFFHSSAEALLSSYRDISKRVDPELPKLFGTLPRLPYGVTAVPPHEERTATTAYYMPGSAEAGRPGWFYANTYDCRSRPTWEMEALTLHEAVPGHHLQIALAAEIDGLPPFRRFSVGEFTAFVEGWGLYAESLGDEMGFYTDPYSRFGKLTYEMWRAVRLVVDTGIHALGWNRERAIEFFRENTGKADHDIAVEVDRYIAWPGQALAYKIGELKIKELRAWAGAELGPRFDVRAFHDEVLGAGALPLDVLEGRIRAWAARVR